MKTTIVLKLMKIVAQSHNHKRTYVHFLNMHNKKLKKLIIQHSHNKSNTTWLPKPETFTHFLQY